MNIDKEMPKIIPKYPEIPIANNIIKKNSANKAKYSFFIDVSPVHTFKDNNPMMFDFVEKNQYLIFLYSISYIQIDLIENSFHSKPYS